MSERLDKELRALRKCLEDDMIVAVESMNFDEASEIRSALILLDRLLLEGRK